MQRTKNVDKVTPRQCQKTMLKYLFKNSEISKTRITKKRTKVRKFC